MKLTTLRPDVSNVAVMHLSRCFIVSLAPVDASQTPEPSLEAQNVHPKSQKHCKSRARAVLWSCWSQLLHPIPLQFCRPKLWQRGHQMHRRQRHRQNGRGRFELTPGQLKLIKPVKPIPSNTTENWKHFIFGGAFNDPTKIRKSSSFGAHFDGPAPHPKWHPKVLLIGLEMQ